MKTSHSHPFNKPRPTLTSLLAYVEVSARALLTYVPLRSAGAIETNMRQTFSQKMIISDPTSSGIVQGRQLKDHIITPNGSSSTVSKPIERLNRFIGKLSPRSTQHTPPYSPESSKCCPTSGRNVVENPGSPTLPNLILPGALCSLLDCSFGSLVKEERENREGVCHLSGPDFLGLPDAQEGTVLYHFLQTVPRSKRRLLE